MATASPKESTSTECHVCLEIFREPKLLPCAHLLCRQCLQSWIQTRSGARCPLCNYSIVQKEKQRNQSLDNIVDGLPTELSMVAYVKAENLLKQQHSCCVCEDVAATCLCLDCGDMFCRSCKNVHNKQTVTKRHRVKDLSSLTTDKVYAINRPVMCPVHPDKACEVFCISHDTAICHVCAVTRHRDCGEMKDLNELMEEAHAVVKRLTARLKAGEDKMDCTIQQLDQHLQDTEKEKQSMIKKIAANCDRLDAAVKACRHRLTEQTLNAYSDIKTAVNDGKTYLFGDKARMTTHKHVAERVQGLQDREDVGTMTTVLESNMDGLNCNATLPADAKVISKMMLVMDPEAVSTLEKALSKLGQVKVVPSELGHVKVVPSDLDARLKENRQGLSVTPEMANLEEQLHTGHRVMWPSDSGNEYGTVKWIGILPDDDSSEVFVGVEFDNKIGTGTGKYKNYRLFYTRPGYAALIPLMRLVRVDSQDELDITPSP